MQSEPPESTEVETHTGPAGVLQARSVSLTNGVALALVGQENAQLRQGGAFAVVGGNTMTLTQGGGQLVVAGNTMTINQGGGQLMIAGNSINIEQGGGGIMLAGQATVNRGFIGVLISGATELQEGAKVLLDTRQALMFGAAFGLVFAIARRVLGR
jgi:hypothetical protein